MTLQLSTILAVLASAVAHDQTEATTTPAKPPTTVHSSFASDIERNTIQNIPPLHQVREESLNRARQEVDDFMMKWKLEEERPPMKFDWRKKKVLMPVRDQMYCSASYAFATIAVLEAQFKIKHNEFKSFSAQQLVDCHIPQIAETYGCSGGSLKNTFDYIQIAAGLMSEWDYPWQGKQGRCRYSAALGELHVNEMLTFEGEETMRYFLYERGPVMAHINPALLANNYAGNIIRADAGACDPQLHELTHNVVVVGFSETEDGLRYWIVRNSWGPRWGYSGYFYIERGVNACGIETYAFFLGIE